MNGNNLLVATIILLCITIGVASFKEENLLWVWKCDSTTESCTRVSSSSSNSNAILYPSIGLCRLVCGQYGALWPRPKTSVLGQELFQFSSNSVKFMLPPTSKYADDFLQGIVKLFLQAISLQNTTSCPQTTNSLEIYVTFNSENTVLDWNTSEKYDLEITTEGSQSSARISSDTIFGVRHALETLSQLMDFYPNNDGSKCLAIVNSARIDDAPAYPHRGLLLDTARNFLSVAKIKKHLDGMAASKLNVLHWHVTDSQSFPLNLPKQPNMTKFGAYSSEKIYNVDDIKDLLSYAKLRGIRIIIEIDAPSHSGNGWQWGPSAGLGNLAVCINEQPYRSYCIQPPCGQLNPINSNLYKVLQDLYQDIINIFPKGEVFHMGGDEVFIPCWNSTPEIISYLGNKPRTTETFLDLWSQYQANALEAYDTAAGNSQTPIILWTSHLTEIDVIEKYLSKDRYVIQTWVPASDNLPNNLLALGYRIIVSTKDSWYLDHGFWGTTTYHNWQNVYSNKIPRNSRTLGGEVCMWGEYVDDSSVESRVWPRAAAAAERLWTDSDSSAKQVEKRFFRHRERLVSRGINAEALLPRWCYQNEGEC